MTTYREIFKYGDKREEAPSKDLLNFFKTQWNLSDDDLKPGYLPGDESVKIKSIELDQKHVGFFEQLIGKGKVKTSDYDRAFHAYGKFYGDILRLRTGEVIAPPDIVLCPSSNDEIEKIVTYCNEQKIAIIPFGGGTSVTRALEAPQGGVCLNLAENFNKIVKINKEDQTVLVESGILGPALEEQLNAAGFTCGHFPQSFEYSTAGGWVAARGAGQCSTGYGRIEDLLVSMSIVSPAGTFTTKDFPAHAQGWNMNEVVCGSEGTLGVLTHITLKIFKHRPKNTTMGSLVFKDFESAVKAMREFMQSECGKPHVFRISDGPETEYAFRSKGITGTYKDKALNFLGYTAPERSMMYFTVEGDRDYARLVKRKIVNIGRKNGGFFAGETAIKTWLEMRYHSSYLRDTYMDVGMMIDTMETAVTWENIIPLWKSMHAYCNAHPKYYAMSHISHVYENGANIYIIFQRPMIGEGELESFEKFQKGLLEVFVNNGGSLSHHHGVGRAFAHLMPTQYGDDGMKILKGVKQTFDPNNIMNPGGTLGLS